MLASNSPNSTLNLEWFFILISLVLTEIVYRVETDSLIPISLTFHCQSISLNFSTYPLL